MSRRRTPPSDRPVRRDRLARLARVFQPLFLAWARRARFTRRFVVAALSVAVAVGVTWAWIDSRGSSASDDARRAVRASTEDPSAREEEPALGAAALEFDLGVEEGRAATVRVTRRDADGRSLPRESVTKRVRTSRFSVDGLPAGDLHVAVLLEGEGRTTWRETTVDDLGADERRTVVLPDELHPGTVRVRLAFVDEQGAPLTGEHLVDVEERYGLEPTATNLRSFGVTPRVTGTRLEADGLEVRLDARGTASSLEHTFDGLPLGRYAFEANGPALRDGLDWAHRDSAFRWLEITEEAPEVEFVARHEAREGPGEGPFVVFGLPADAELARGSSGGAYARVTSANGGGLGPVRTKHRAALGGPYLWLGEGQLERVAFSALVHTSDGSRFYYDGVSRDRALDDAPLVVEPLDTVEVRLFHSGVGLDAGSHTVSVAPSGDGDSFLLTTALAFESVATGQARLLGEPLAVPPGWRVRLGRDGPTWVVPPAADLAAAPGASSGAVLLPES